VFWRREGFFFLRRATFFFCSAGGDSGESLSESEESDTLIASRARGLPVESGLIANLFLTTGSGLVGLRREGEMEVGVG
jgi:hypothetical protein